jgi:glycosyltransferase involved in cell wall biosynthesis
MRVLFASTLRAHWGGSEWLWAETALHLARQGHAVGFCQPWEKDHPAIAALRAAGASEIAEIRPTPWHRRWWRSAFDRRSFAARTLAEFAPGLAVISQARQDEGVEWRQALAAARVPYVILNELTVDNLYLEDAEAEALGEFLAGARRLYFVAERSRILLEVQLGRRFPNARVVRNPFRVPYGAPFAWPPGPDLRLGLVARLDPDTKGQDALFEALARPRWRERPVWLHLFGRGSAERRLRRLQAMLGLERIVFEGFAEQLGPVWERCHVVAAPSRQEGLPISVVEGMLMGRPVFATAVAGIPEIVEDGVSGILAPACGADLLDDALDRLWSLRERLPDMGRAAQERARQRVPADPALAFAKELLSALE